jgi:hypothetical protein
MHARPHRLKLNSQLCGFHCLRAICIRTCTYTFAVKEQQLFHTTALVFLPCLRFIQLLRPPHVIPCTAGGLRAGLLQSAPVRSARSKVWHRVACQP